MRRDKIRTRSATVSPGWLGPVLPGAAAAADDDDVCVCVRLRALWKLACASLCFACSQDKKGCFACSKKIHAHRKNLKKSKQVLSLQQENTCAGIKYARGPPLSHLVGLCRCCRELLLLLLMMYVCACVHGHSGSSCAHLCALRAARIKKGVLRAATKYMRIEKINKIKKSAFLAARKYMRRDKIRTRSATVSPGWLGPVLPGAAAAADDDDVCVCVRLRALSKLVCASLCFACSQNIKRCFACSHKYMRCCC